MAAFVYEGLLVFAVAALTGLVYGLLTQQRHAMQGHWGLMIALFLTLGLYFVWFWTHGGQTVAMRTWRIRLVAADGGPVRTRQAVMRYAAAWLWFLLALAMAGAVGLKTLGGGGLALLLSVGIAAYAALAWLGPQRQFWHDVVCGTRLVISESGMKKAR